MRRYRKIKIDYKSPLYGIINRRNRNSIMVHRIANMPNPRVIQQDSSITETVVKWKQGTHMWRLASEFYGDHSLYWVIAAYNGKPTDAHWKIGEKVKIPFPVARVISYFEGIN